MYLVSVDYLKDLIYDVSKTVPVKRRAKSERMVTDDTVTIVMMK